MKVFAIRPIAKPLTLGMLLVASTVGLSGCAAEKQMRRSMADTQHATQQAAYEASVTRDPMDAGVFQVTDGFHAAQSPLQPTDLGLRDRLPAPFQRDASITRGGTASLTDLTAHISRVSGYRTTIESDLDAAVLSSGIQYKGTLAGLLDDVASKVGGAWRWSGDTISFYKYETRMFRLDYLPGTTDSSAKLSTTATQAASGGSGSTGTSGQDVNMESTFDIWKDVADTVKGSLSSGGVYSISPSAGTLTVRDTPQVMRVIEAQVKEFNRIYSNQVLLDVKVYAVERTASQAMSMDWTVAWQAAANRYNLGFSSNGAGGAVSGGAAPGISGTINTGPFAGSGALFQALNSLGNARLVTSGTVSSLNGQTVPLNVAREIAYLQSYATTLASGTGGTSTTTLTPGVVTEGFSMNFTPRILQDNRVLLRYSVDLSSVDAIETFESPDGNSSIQLPRRSVRNFMQNVSMRSGQTLVLTGFQQANSNMDSSGMFSPKAWILGGGKKNEELLRTIVIVVTPRIVK
jgi:type IVB pilus formation R64 PilN family outer membrane protein